MLTFKEFVDKKHLDKKQILNYWANLPSRKPIPVQPMPHDHYGTSMDEDTIRITGSQQFVEAILQRLQEVLAFENQQTELNVRYEMLDYEHAGGLQPNYAFYCSVKYRNPGAKIPRGPVKIR